MRKKIKASDLRRFQQISEILGISTKEAEELSSVVTEALREAKKESENPHINALIHSLADEKSLTKAIE